MSSVLMGTGRWPWTAGLWACMLQSDGTALQSAGNVCLRAAVLGFGGVEGLPKALLGVGGSFSVSCTFNKLRLNWHRKMHRVRTIHSV